MTEWDKRILAFTARLRAEEGTRQAFAEAVRARLAGVVIGRAGVASTPVVRPTRTLLVSHPHRAP